MLRYDEYHVYLGMKRIDGDYLGGTYVKSKQSYRFPKNLHSLRELYSFTKNEELIPLGKEESSKLDSILSLKNTNVVIDPKLRPYQNQDVYYLSNVEYAGVFLEPRLGKTPIMIKVLENIQAKKSIVICPSSLVLNWAKEFKQWYPEMIVYSITGAKTKRGLAYHDYDKHSRNKHSVLIISKDTWKLDKDLHDWTFDTAIVDEAHFLRNWKSKQSEAIFKIKATYRYPLTGTPSVKHGSDVYGLLHFIDPTRYSSYWQFTDRYWEIQDNGWGKDIANAKRAREKELLSLMAINSVQRKRQDVMKWLPKAQHQTIPVQLEGKQLKLYNQMLDTFMADDEETEHEIDTMNKLSQLMRLRQLNLDPRLLGFKEVGSKTTALMDFAEGMNEPFVVMSMLSSYFNLVKGDLEKLGKKVEVIDGSVSKTNRQRIVELFQRGDIDILLANIIAAGTGITLDRSDTIIFLDKSFNPADNEQAEARILPTTEERYHSVNIISLVCSDTIDERINEILDRKQDLTDIINKGGWKSIVENNTITR
jgi:SNF2 family DNA or RNA helicase